MAVTRSRSVRFLASTRTGIPNTTKKTIMKKKKTKQGQKSRKNNKYQDFMDAKQDCYDGDYANGLKKLGELILWDIPARNPTFRAYLAFFQLEIGKYKEAILTAEESLKIKSTALAHKTRFQALLKLGRISEGKKILDEIKRLRSSQMRRLCEISVLDDLLDRHLLLLDEVKVHFEAGHYELTIQKCEVGLKIAPLDIKLLIFKTGSLFLQKRYSDVVKLRSIDVVMENPKCLEWISLSYYLMLDMTEAVNVLGLGEVQHASSAPLCATLKKIHELWADAVTRQEEPAVVCEAARSALSLMAHITSNKIPVVNRELELELMKLAFSSYEKLGNKHDEVLHLLKEASDKGYEICPSPFLKTILQVSEQLRNKCWKEAASMIESALLSSSPPGEFPTSTFDFDVSMWTEKLRVVKILADCKSRKQLGVVQAAEIIEYKNDLLKSNLADLKKCYSLCIRKYHPDKQSGNLDDELKHLYEELTKICVQAFEVLKTEFSTYVENQKRESKRKEDEKNKQVYRSDFDNGRDANYFQSAEWAARKTWSESYTARQKRKAEEKAKAAAAKAARKEEERKKRRETRKAYEHFLANRK